MLINIILPEIATSQRRTKKRQHFLWRSLIPSSVFLICFAVGNVNADNSDDLNHDIKKTNKTNVSENNDADALDEELLNFLSDSLGDFDKVDDETFDLVLFHGMRDSEKQKKSDSETNHASGEVKNNEQ